MQTLIAIAALGVFCLIAEIFNLRKALVPVTIAGLLAVLGITLNVWSFGSEFDSNYVNMIKLVAALVAGCQHTVVIRKIRHRIIIVRSRFCYLRPFAAGHRHGIDIPDTAFIRAKQNAGFVCTECGTADTNGFDEVLDFVLFGGACDRVVPGSMVRKHKMTA